MLYTLKNTFLKSQFLLQVQDRCVVEGVDSVMMHEIVLGGHLYLQLLKEKLHRWAVSVKYRVMEKANEAKSSDFRLSPEVKLVFFFIPKFIT